MRIVLLLLFFLLASPVQGQAPPARSSPMVHVLPHYHIWALEVQRCVGHAASKPFDSLEWWVVDTAQGFEYRGGDDWAGYYEPRGPNGRPRIYLVSYGVLDPWLVKHELLHWVLDPISGHPRPPYGVCAGA